MAQRVNSEEFYGVLGSHVLLADFYSDSCIPCKRMSPILAELEEEFTDVKFVKINAAYEEELTEKYEVMSSPTLIIFVDGKEADRMHGAASKQETESFIRRNIS